MLYHSSRLSRLLADARNFPKLTFLGDDRVRLLQPSKRNCKQQLLFGAGADPSCLGVRLHGEEDREEGNEAGEPGGIPKELFTSLTKVS